MKRKIKKIKTAKAITERLEGIATWRVTGPSVDTGERVTVVIDGTRKEAERFKLR